MRTSLLLLALVACKPDETDTSVETGETGETDTVVACDQFAFGGALDIPDDAIAPSGQVTVGMFPFDMGVDSPEFTVTYATTTLAMPAVGTSAPYELCMPAVPSEEWLSAVDTDASARAAMFVVGAWIDDGDGTFEVGEELVGATMTFVAYVDGTLPPEIADLGAEEGWNLLYFDIFNMDAGPTSATPFQSGFTGLPLPGNLMMNDRASIDGVVGPSGLGDVQVGLMSSAEMMNLPPPTDPLLSSVTVDVSAPGAAFALPVVDPPPEHVATDLGDGPAGAEVAMYYAQAWEDLDDDGAYDDGEPIVAHSLAAGDASRIVAWIHPTEFTAMAFAALFGGVGWQVLEVPAQNEAPVVADWDVGLVLGDQFGP